MTDQPGSSRGTTRTNDLEIERRILRARTAAMDALDQGNWDAVVLSCGKVLQEVARNELPYNEHGGTLPQLLERLARRLQTDQPVSDLAVALKDASGLRGFFDLETDVDEELARATVSVIEAFLTYTYAFREEVHRLTELAAARRERATATTPVEPEADRAVPETPAPDMPAPTPGARTQSGEAQTGADDREPSRRSPTDVDRTEREDRSNRERGERPDRDDRQPSAFDRFEDRKDDPIRQTWKPPRSKD